MPVFVGAAAGVAGSVNGGGTGSTGPVTGSGSKAVAPEGMPPVIAYRPVPT